MPSTLPFWAAFITTVLLLVSALVTGFARRRRAHLLLGPLTMVALTITIFLTEQLMAHYEFPREELDFHLIFAKAGGLLAVPVILTGIWLLRSHRARVWHRVSLVLWLLGVLTATGTGLYVFTLGVAKVG